MHIPDGILPAPVCVAAAIGAAGATLAGLRNLPDRYIPRLAVTTALFFVVGTLHVRIGPTSVHFLCTGLLAAILGWRAIVPVSVGVLLQAVLLQHGGLTTVGVNALVLGLPAMIVGAFLDRLGAWRDRLGPWHDRPGARPDRLGPWREPRLAWYLGAGGTVAAYVLSMTLVAMIGLMADARLLAPMGVWAAMYVPVMALEAIMAGSALAHLTRIQHGVLQECRVGEPS